jgi:hypothetical protein
MPVLVRREGSRERDKGRYIDKWRERENEK